MSRKHSPQLQVNLEEIPMSQRSSTPLLTRTSDYANAKRVAAVGAAESKINESKTSPTFRVTELDPQETRLLSVSDTASHREQAQDGEIGGLPKIKHLHDIYWLSPFGMVSFLLVGILAGIGHHCLYQYFAGREVGDSNEQQRSHEYDIQFFNLLR